VVIRVTGFGAVVGFVAEPAPPGVPSRIDSMCSEAEAVCRASAIVVLQSEVRS
jgi:hypothetical protein